MHSIRRSAFRAVASSSTSFSSKSRSISTLSPFTTRIKPQATLYPIFRRFASNDVETEGRRSESETTPSSSNIEDQSSVASAISSAAESASSYVSNAAEKLSENTSVAKDKIVDAASGVAAAARLGYAPREDGREYRPAKQYREGRTSDRPTRFEDESRGSGRPSAPIPPNSGIYIGNFPFETTEEDLRQEFSQFGRIEKISIAMDHRELSKGFGYISFDSVEAATAAIQGKDQTLLGGRRIVVNYQLRNYRPAGTQPPGKTLFIGNLPFEMTDADLNALFREIENVMDVRVAIDRRTGQPRGFAHADFMDIESATKGLELLKGKEYYGRVLRVDFAGQDRKTSNPNPRL